MTISIGPPTGIVQTPPSQPRNSSATLAAPQLKFRVEHPFGTGRPADLVKLVNQDQHLFVVWGGDSQQGDLAALYSVTGNGTPVWTQQLTGRYQLMTYAWDAKAGDEWLLVREDNSSFGGYSPEVSKWDLTGVLWTSSAFNVDMVPAATTQAGGIASDGVRSVIVGIEVANPNGMETNLLEGSDDTISTQLSVGSDSNWAHAAVSRDGEHMIRVDPNAHVIHNLETDTVTLASSPEGYQMPPNYPGHGAWNVCAISGDGAEAVMIDTQANQARLYVWGGASYTASTFNLPGVGYSVAMSNDGSKFVVGSMLGVGTVQMTTFDVATTAQVATYTVQLPYATNTLKPIHLAMEDDGSTYGFALNYSDTGAPSTPLSFRAATSETAYQAVGVAPPGANCIKADFGTLGTYMATATYSTAGAEWVYLHYLP